MVGEGITRRCEEVSAGCEIIIVDVIAAAPCPITTTEVELPACPPTRVLSFGTEVADANVDVLDGSCAKTVVTGTIAVVSRLKNVERNTVCRGEGVRNLEWMVVVSSMGRKVMAWKHRAVVVGHWELTGWSGPGVAVEEELREVREAGLFAAAPSVGVTRCRKVETGRTL